MSPGADPTHWLYRFTADEWLSAADKELALSAQSLRAKRRREGLTYARRAAGMALNAWLAVAANEGYGRSYMDHLKALAGDGGASEPVRADARSLLEAELASNVVPLGPGPTDLADAAGRIVAFARERVATSPRA